MINLCLDRIIADLTSDKWVALAIALPLAMGLRIIWALLP